MRRRSLLASLGLGTAALAGCGGRSLDLGPLGGDDAGTDRGTDGADAGGDAADDGATPTAVDLPYRGEAGENVDRPRGLRVSNDSGRGRYVTVAVTTADGRDLLVASRSVGDESTLRYPNVVARRGTYGVVVETADGRRLDSTWRVTDVRGDFEARLDRGLSAAQTATCAPDCPPLSTGGDRATYDTGDARGTFYLLNRRSAPVRTELRLASAYRTALEYGYEVPPGVRVAVPAVGWGEPEYEATVAVDGESTTEGWRRADGDRMFAIVDDDGTRFLCDTHFRDLRVRNETTRERSVSVTVRGDGSPTVDGTFDVPAEGFVRRRNVVAPANRYGFDLSTADGESTTTEWNICPSRGAINVIVSDRGLWVGVRSMR